MNASGRRPPQAVQQVRDLAWTGKHSEAVDVATAALERTTDPVRRLDLLDQRSESLLALGDLERAKADAAEMIRLAKQKANAASRAQALNRRCYVEMRGGAIDAALRTAKAAVKAAVMAEDVARTVHIARQLGEPLPMAEADIDSLYARYQNVYGQ